MKLIVGDSEEILDRFQDNTFDAVVTDPPYGCYLYEWDDIGSEELWRNVYRVLKPGHFLVATGCRRTHKTLIDRLDKIGFEFIDKLTWMMKTNRGQSPHFIIITKKPGNGPTLLSYDRLFNFPREKEFMKPIALIEYFIKLVCPIDGHVLDPFCGYGPTSIAALRLGNEFTGIDQSAETIAIHENNLRNFIENNQCQKI